MDYLGCGVLKYSEDLGFLKWDELVFIVVVGGFIVFRFVISVFEVVLRLRVFFFMFIVIGYIFVRERDK